ncbi:hypothetical protein [Stenoxybacter acetivorans]|uniref:hypothetical protein n=1 Tax=Stenoxybacter acetivorans TaxID=422441 RepID=UPI0006907936|nr:hypothetical protein [Stenoxybacter acetivorans]
MKLLAYTSAHGNSAVTALTAKLNKGRTGQCIYYSRHPAGQRLEMYLQRRGEKHFFAYKGERGQQIGISEPETLTHALCKNVLAELANTGLETLLELTENTERQPPFAVCLVSGETEKRLTIDNQDYVIDVLCVFRQPEDESLLSHEIRWNGQLVFEIWHSHRLAANDPKCTALAKHGLPVIQIAAKGGDFLSIDEDALLQMSDEEAQEHIDKHLQKLKNAFNKRIVGTLLKNPKSSVYQRAESVYLRLNGLEQENTVQRQLLDELEQEKQHWAEDNQRLQTQLTGCLNQLQQGLQQGQVLGQNAAATNGSRQDSGSGVWRRIKRWFDSD